jgi:pyruvate,orthophosphate dikinase
MSNKWVYQFNELDQAEKYVGGVWDNVRGLLGGKGANLAEMTRIGVPVPPGFIITTEACNAYLAAGENFPPGMWQEVLQAIESIEKQTGKKFGSPQNPLLVSCRSGAKFSMPGMMDTILNIGLNDQTAAGLIEMTGNERFVCDSYRRLVQMFGTVVMGIPDDAFEEKLDAYRSRAGVKTDAELKAADLQQLTKDFKQIYQRHTGYLFPDEPYEQLKSAIDAVFKSWNGKRAVDYRNASGIPHDLGTAVNIVTMVFGNLGEDSLTGVALSRNGTTGENKIEGDYLKNAQGEDVVAGIRQTNEISQLREDMPEINTDFEQTVKKLEAHYRDMQDIEFTVEKGKLWILQTRDGKRTAQAAVRIAVEMAEDELISRQQAV